MDINPLKVFHPSSAKRNGMWLRVLSLGLGLVCWQITSIFSGVEVFILPPPLKVW